MFFLRTAVTQPSRPPPDVPDGVQVREYPELSAQLATQTTAQQLQVVCLCVAPLVVNARFCRSSKCQLRALPLRAAGTPLSADIEVLGSSAGTDHGHHRKDGKVVTIPSAMTTTRPDEWPSKGVRCGCQRPFPGSETGRFAWCPRARRVRIPDPRIAIRHSRWRALRLRHPRAAPECQPPRRRQGPGQTRLTRTGRPRRADVERFQSG